MQVVTGLPWYRSVEDYGQVRAISADAEGFHDTYEEWLAHAEVIEQFWQRDGGRTVRAYLEAADFAKWCGDRALNIDAQARASFASEVAGQVIFRERSGHPDSPV